MACLITKGEKMIQPEDFTAHIGQEVVIQGIAQRSKAGALLLSGNHEIWLDNYDWEDTEMDKKVQVKGILLKGLSPIASFPVATQDENGAWSQGVGGPSSDLQPSIERSSGENWLLQVQSVSVLSN